MSDGLDKEILFIAGEGSKKIWRPDWSIREVDSQGHQLEYIPSEARFTFKISELTYQTETCLGYNQDGDSETIYGKLIPNDRWRLTYRFFGTDRVLENFQLEVKVDDEGGVLVAAEPENDYWRDTVWVTLILSRDRFSDLKNALLKDAISSCSLSINRVSGFYAIPDPTPSSDNPEEVKVLWWGSPRLAGTENSDIELPKTGKVGGFNFRWYLTRNFD